MTTLREFEMLRFINNVTDKIDWHIKVGCWLCSIALSPKPSIDQ